MATKRQLPRLPAPQSTDIPELEYRRLLLKYQRVYREKMTEAIERILPKLRDTASREAPRLDAERMDVNIEDTVAKLLEGVLLELEKVFPTSLLRKWALGMVGNVNLLSKRNTARAAKAAGLEAEPLLKDGGLSPYFQNVVDENVGLIRSIAGDRIPQMKTALVSAITQDKPVSEIREILQKNFKLSKGKASLLARDQVGKLNGRLNQYRQQQLGGKRYRWRGTLDVAERPDHRRLEGKIFSWNSPPIMDRRSGRRGHPGEDYQCRCHAELVMEDIIE